MSYEKDEKPQEERILTVMRKYGCERLPEPGDTRATYLSKIADALEVIYTELDYVYARLSEVD